MHCNTHKASSAKLLGKIKVSVHFFKTEPINATENLDLQI